MSLILATGSNLGDRVAYLAKAKQLLSQHFEFLESSQIYSSEPVGYLNQPNFLNQVLEFKKPQMDPNKILKITQSIEEQLGRVRNIPLGPRTIDIDILFIGLRKIQTTNLVIPHSEWRKRSFVVLPLKELSFAKKYQQQLNLPHSFTSQARPFEPV